MTGQTSSPFLTDASEIPLAESPLVSVVAQLRFPLVAALHDIAGVVDFQDRIKGVYPVMRRENQSEVAFSADGAIVPGTSVPLWRFNGEEPGWIATLAPSWIALETTKYVNRDDFMTRWKFLLEVLATTNWAPRVFDRLGVRYVDQLVGDQEMSNLRRHINPSVFGAVEIEDVLNDGAKLVGTVTQAHFELPGAVMMSRWGKIPAGVAALPGIPPVDGVSWFLDVDVFLEGDEVTFDPASVVATSRSFAQHAYNFFRWVITDDLIISRGGAV